MHKINVAEMRGKISLVLAVAVAMSTAIIGILSASNETKSGEKVVVGTGTIRFLYFEGGFYGIVSDDEKRYDPLNLDQEFKVEGLRIYFELKTEQVYTIHMWGTPVTVLKIQKLVLR